MDVVADADGNPDQDIRRFPNYEDKQKEGMEFNMILCWAIGCAASRTREFYLLSEKNLLKEFLMRKIPKKKNPVHSGD